ncbi:MAG: radical SAM protein [Alphaproteobacteria bacterium]
MTVHAHSDPQDLAVVDAAEAVKDIPEQLLRIRRLRQMGVELTTTCNLACVYCHFAPLSRRGKDANPLLIEGIVDFLRDFPVDYVTMSGDAEITMLTGWTDVARRILAMGIDLRTISNFSKGIFSDEEVDVFSQFRQILISLDTSDAALLKKIRYRADLRTITLNMQLVRARAIATGRPIPEFVCNVVLHDKNVSHADKTVAFAIANGFAQVSMVRYVDLEEVSGGINDLRDNPNATQVYQIRTLDDAGLHAGVQALRAAVSLAENRINLSIQPDILEEINAGLNGGEDAKTTAPIYPPGTRRTKSCMMPWDFYYVFWNGDVPPCCIVKDTMVDNVLGKPITDSINSAEMMEWRRTLLTGDLKPECETCTYVADTDTQSLRTQVEQYLTQYGDLAS